MKLYHNISITIQRNSFYFLEYLTWVRQNMLMQHSIKNSAFMDEFISSVDKTKSRNNLATQKQTCD